VNVDGNKKLLVIVVMGKMAGRTGRVAGVAVLGGRRLAVAEQLS
jgi:hypothetical protein